MSLLKRNNFLTFSLQVAKIVSEYNEKLRVKNNGNNT